MESRLLTGFDTPVEVAVASVADGFERVLQFDAGGQNFTRFDADAPLPLNTLTEVALGDALWLQVAQDTTWIQGRPSASRDVDILPGFNFVSWTGPSQTPIAEALGEIVDSVDAVFTFNPPTETFESFRPVLPPTLNDPIVLDYGQGLWVLASGAGTWHQPGPKLVGVQDMWVFTRLVRRGDSGEEIDLLAGLGAALGPDLGPGAPLRIGMTFRPIEGLGGAVQDSSGDVIDSISLHYGVIENGQVLDELGRLIPSDLTDVFFPDANELLVAYSTARFDLAERNIGEEDFILLDLARFPQVEPGDTLVADIAFGQLLPPADPALEDGLTPAEIFYRRWTVGGVLFTGADEEIDGEFTIFVGAEISVAGAEVLAPSELTVSQNSRGFAMLRGKVRTGARVARKIRDEITAISPPAWIAPGLFVLKVLAVDGFWVTSVGAQLLVNAGSPPPPPPPPTVTTGPGLDPLPPDKQRPSISFETTSDTCDAEHGSLIVRVSVVDSGGLSENAFSADGVGGTLAEKPTSKPLSGSEEVSFVRFSNATDSPQTVRS